MRIGIIGSGKIGGTVGRLLAQAGHEVFLSSRHPDRNVELADDIIANGGSASCGTVREAAQFGETILFAPPFWQRDAALSLINGGTDLTEKVVIDATNPFTEKGEELALPPGRTAVSELVKKIPKARVVKAFNTVYWQTLRDSHHGPFEDRYVLCYAGDEQKSKNIVSRLIEDTGFIAYDLGPLQNADLMEPGGPFFNQELTFAQAEIVLKSLGLPKQEAA